MGKIFYVCSYGGSGSIMLQNALKQYGETSHIHSRNPPDKLEYVGNKGGGRTKGIWFNGKVIPENELDDYYVLYIYRNPSFSIKSIQSRFHMHLHLQHVQCKNRNVKLNEVLESGKDLYGVKEFYNNYMKKNKNRNYKIICVKYEDIFDKQDELSNLLGIGKLNLVNKSKNKQISDTNYAQLDTIYADLIEEMNKNDSITVN